MMQFSVYIKRCKDQSQIERLAIELSKIVPDNGKVDMVIITDKQYENVVTYYGRQKVWRENPANLTLF